MNQRDRKGPGATPRRKFDETYKRHAVELTLHGDRTVKTVAKELGLPAWQLYDWRKLYAPRPGGGGPAPQTLEEAVKENERLRSELIRMREREEALKKITGHPLRSARERYAQIKAMKGQHPIRMLCELLNVSASGYYRWRSAAAEYPAARGRGHRGEGRGGPPRQPGHLWSAADPRGSAGGWHAHEQGAAAPV